MKLLAKSCDRKDFQNDNERYTLRFHLRLTFAAARVICELTGRRQLEAIGFDPNDYFDRFKKILLSSLGNIQDFIASPGGQGFKNDLEDLCFESEPNGEDDTLYISSSFMASIRSSLMAADAASSAMGEGCLQNDVESCLTQWIRDHLKDLPTFENFQKIVERKQAEFKNDSPDERARSRQKFQDETAQSKARITLCIAGCGSGKTFAAWKWALNSCRNDGNRLFFCYPTTGTASEGFMDYLINQGDLIHSRSQADYELLDKLRINEKVYSKKTEDPFDTDSMMKSLEFWRSSVACCTVDTVLKMLVGGYSGHLIWPVIAQSSFIFDEIHSYDETLFQRLLQFLENIKGAKVLLLTASLPQDRLKKLCQSVKRNKINGSSEKINIIEGTGEWETIRRYQQMKSEQDPVDLVIDRYRKGQKILWICNTVGRAINAREKVIRRLNEIDNNNNRNDDNIIIFHSHFKYENRIKRHEDCMKAFKNDGPVLCFATQVAEMSLDISADFLVTDAAPIPALIQRLGRLNRRALFDDPKPFLIIDPKNEEGKHLTLPYSTHNDSWLNVTSEWLELLVEKPLSQKDLVEKWKQVGKTGLETDQTNTVLSWNAPGPWMEESNLRDASSGCNVLLMEDLKSVITKGNKEYIVKVIPMQEPPFKIKNKLEYCNKYGCYIIKNGTFIEYDEKIGGRWINSENKDEKESPDGIKEILIF